MADIAIVGAGYVGVPLAQVFAEAGRSVLLVDSDPERVAQLNAGESYIEDVPSEAMERLVTEHGLRATTDYDDLRDADAILIALPTPLSKQREPDLSIVKAAIEEIAKRLRAGHVVVLESTTYPGTTREEVLPRLEASALSRRRGLPPRLLAGARRPRPRGLDDEERPKIVGGITEACTERAAAVYEGAVDSVHRVSSPESAELAKLLENIFRSVNIALVNELAQLCERMKIDLWEVVDAAATKPFGFMSFKPGPGLGGHCIPIDPFYLTWKAREYDFYHRVHRAGRQGQREHAVLLPLAHLAGAEPRQAALALEARVLVLGVAYKPGIADSARRPALKLIELLHAAGADVSYHDPHVPELDELGLRSVAARARAPTTASRSSPTTRDRLRGARRRLSRGRRLPQRHGREGPPEQEGLEAVTRPRSPSSGSATGARTSRATSTSSRSSRGSATPTRSTARRIRGAAIRRRARPATSTSCSPTRSSTRSSIATPVPTHYELAQPRARGRQARVRREAAGDERRRDGRAHPLADARDLVLMPGHLLLYHPGVRKLKELVDGGELGEVLCVYTNRQNLGIVRTNENALWSLGVHDLSVILWLVGEEPERGGRVRPRLPHGRRRGRRLLLPPLPVREDRAHAPLVARPAQDAQDDRRRPGEDGRVRRHGARAQGDRLREGPVEAVRAVRRVADALGRHPHPEDRRTPSRCASSARPSST